MGGGGSRRKVECWRGKLGGKATNHAVKSGTESVVPEYRFQKLPTGQSFETTESQVKSSRVMRRSVGAGKNKTILLHFMICHSKKCHRPRTSSCHKVQRGGTKQ